MTSIQSKFSLVLAFFLVFTVAAVSTTLYVVRSQMGDAAVIDIASSQGVLAFRMEAETQALIADLESESTSTESRDQLKRSVAQYDRQLAALLDGGMLSEQDDLRLPASSGELRTTLEAVAETWAGIRTHLDAVSDPGADVASDAFYEASSSLEGFGKLLLKDSAGVVPLLRDAAEGKVSLLMSILVVSLLGTFLVAGLSWFAVRRYVVAPMERLRDEVSRAAENYDLTTSIAIDSHDEVGSIAQTVNHLFERLRDTIQLVTSNAEKAATIAGEVAEMTLQTKSGVHQQMQKTESVATAMNEMRASVDDVANHASDAAGTTSSAASEASNGRSVAEAASTSIANLEQTISESAKALQELDDGTSKITSVLDVIRGISEQTNLLALNAAIEAARAGEQGRGFAVVADEVRALATRSHEATEEIGKILTQLQNATQHTITVMDMGQKGIHESVDSTTQAVQIFMATLSQVGNIDQLNAQIAVAAQEQRAVAEDIDRNLVGITDFTAHVSERAESTASASEAMRSIAQELKDAVRLFRV